MSLMLMILISMLISMLFIMITLLLSKNSLPMKNKFTPFECGFSPMNSPRSSFSIQFFLISILFLIFDIEIILMIPLPITMIKNIYFLLSSIFIIMILMLGLFFEWKIGSLKWN